MLCTNVEQYKCENQVRPIFDGMRRKLRLLFSHMEKRRRERHLTTFKSEGKEILHVLLLTRIVYNQCLNLWKKDIFFDFYI